MAGDPCPFPTPRENYASFALLMGHGIEVFASFS